MNSLENSTSPLFLVPWIVGIYERGVEHPNELNFMRTGIIFSSYLIIVAGYLDFNRTFDNYFVIEGIENNRKPKPQVNASYPDAKSSPVKFIRYEDGYVDGSQFTMAIIYLARPFDLERSKFMTAISSAKNTNGADKSLLDEGFKYFPDDYLNKPVNCYMGGYNVETGQLSYLTTTKDNKFSQFFNEKGELGGVRDGCLEFGNFLLFLLPKGLDASELSFGFIGLKSEPDKKIGLKNYTENDVKFDVPFCPRRDFLNLTNIVIVTPAFRFESLINGALGCAPDKLSCDTICYNFKDVCDGLPDCSKGQDEMEIYCRNKGEYSKDKGKKEDSNDSNGLTIGIVIGIAILLIFLITVISWKIIMDKNETILRLSKKEVDEFIYGKKNDEEDATIENYEGIAYNKNYEINPKVLKPNNPAGVLGSGAYGVVILAELSESNEKRVQVAVKSTKEDADIEYIRSILSEIKIFQYLGQHVHIIGFIGAVTKDIRAGKVSVVMEFCELGSLFEYLKTSKPSISQMIQWAFEIACGMEHLETKKVVHADLATRNILLTLQKSVKITDFGLSRKLYNYDIYSKQNRAPLPWPWMALESLSHLNFSSKSDVWSYGVTLWEIFSGGKTPYVCHTWSTDFVNLIENGLRLNRPNDASIEMFNLMEQCWLKLPEDRPTFANIVQDNIHLFSKNSNLYMNL